VDHTSDFIAANRATRDEMLARVRERLDQAGRRPASAGSPPPSPRPGGLQGLPSGDDALKARFVRCALASSSSVEELTALASVPEAVARYLASQQLPARAAIWDELAALDWPGAGVEVHPRAADGDDAVGITGAFCALAETGTLLLLGGVGCAATTSLLPATHIAVIRRSRIVAGMEEAFALALAERGEMPRAANFISGPSRTGDIEQTIVLGAHGPSRVHLIIVDGA
jgi:L-lactate dehydrogenase complex protein LldG